LSLQLANTFVDVILQGRKAGGADPLESFQLFTTGYVEFWNDDDRSCDTVSWTPWYASNAYLTLELRDEFNRLVVSQPVIKTLSINYRYV
jgi:hypothetical protein